MGVTRRGSSQESATQFDIMHETVCHEYERFEHPRPRPARPLPPGQPLSAGKGHAVSSGLQPSPQAVHQWPIKVEGLPGMFTSRFAASAAGISPRVVANLHYVHPHCVLFVYSESVNINVSRDSIRLQFCINTSPWFFNSAGDRVALFF